ncbi:MAG: hypothetical protein U1F36_14820 [Planctomycetota bacterium]
MTTPTTRFRPPAPIAPEWWRIVVLAVLLAACVFAFLWPSRQKEQNVPEVAGSRRVQIDVPSLDRELLATVKDSTPQDRLVTETEPLNHLLDKSLGVLPTAAEALGRPREPVPLSVLQGSPQTYRGAWLWYSGRLRYVSEPKTGHPIDGYRIYEGFIETDGVDGGGVVMFRVSRVAPGVTIGDWVRVEGFFMKLRDSRVLPDADHAPLLVGSELMKDFQPWVPVEKLDPAMFADLHDGRFSKGESRDRRFEVIEEGDSQADLESSQSEPLWYLASYAMHRRGGPDDDLPNWRLQPAFVKDEQYRAIAFTDEVPRGSPYRLLGTFVMSHWFAANPNPIGVSYWSTVWIQSPNLGGKLLPIWVPRKIEGFEYGDPLEVRAYWFKRHHYELARGGEALTPVFVAADLDRYVTLPESPVVTALKYVFAGLVAVIVGVFYFVSRADKRRRDEHEERMTKRRRKHMGEAHAEASTTSPS